MKRSPGPIPWIAVDEQQRRVGVVQLRLHAPLHALGQRVARALHARQVDRARAASRPSVATPRIARRVVCGLSETIATLRPTIALTSVDLPTFGRPASATKPLRVARRRRALAAHSCTQRSSSACSASISPSSVSWSIPARWSAPWTIASRTSSRAARADDDVAELARCRADAAAVARRRRSGTTARRSARPCRGGRG